MYYLSALSAILLGKWFMYINELRKRATSDKFGESFKQAFEEEKLKMEAIINTVMTGVGLIIAILLHRAQCYSY
jgi:hypothetical protein